MPLYDYCCPDGHVHELLADVSRLVAPCPECQQVASRSAVNRVATLRTDLLSMDSTEFRQMTRLYREASAELDHTYAQAEANTGQTIQGPDLWSQAKDRARQMQLAGEARLPAEKKGL
jgi:hypothetical protein